MIKPGGARRLITSTSAMRMMMMRPVWEEFDASRTLLHTMMG